MWTSFSKWVLLTGCRQVFYKSIFPSTQGLERSGWCLVFVFSPHSLNWRKIGLWRDEQNSFFICDKMNVFCDIDSALWWWGVKNLKIGKSLLFGLEDKTSQSSYSAPPHSPGLILLPGCSLKVKAAVFLLDLLLWSLGCVPQDPMFVSTSWVPERFFQWLFLMRKRDPEGQFVT